MSNELVQVKTYHVEGDGITLYFLGDDPAALELTYNDAQGERKFSGKEISQQETPTGLMVSVMMEAIPDLRTVGLSLALPAANRPADMRSVMLKTFAVRITNHTTIAGPDIIEGATQTYEVFVLDGNAW